MQHVTMGLAGLTMAFCVAANAAVSNVFELSFDDSGNPGMDSSGNGNDATLNGGATWVAGGQTGGARTDDEDVVRGVCHGRVMPTQSLRGKQGTIRRSKVIVSHQSH